MQAQFNEICFYSGFGNGDLFNSREIIKEIVYNNKNYVFYYAHSKSPRMFADIPIKYAKLQDFMQNDRPFIIGQNNDLYINTWIGRDPKYVLPGIGCILKNYIVMFQEILKQIGLKPLTKTEADYVPTFDYSKFEIQGVKDFITSYGKNNNILISNGDAWSAQAINFSFTPAIIRLVERFPHHKFIITEAIDNYSAPNLFYSGDITKTSDGFDLPEISYLSTFCNLIIGRASGPQVFAQVKENIFDKNKIFLIFSKHVNSAKLTSSDVLRLSKLYHSSTTDVDKVYEYARMLIENEF